MTPRFTEFFVLQKFDDYLAKRLVRNIARRVRESAGKKVGLAILQFHRHRIFSFNRIHDFRRTQSDIHIVMPVPMHQRLALRSDFHIEYAHLIVAQRKPVMRLCGNLNFRSRLARKHSR